MSAAHGREAGSYGYAGGSEGRWAPLHQLLSCWTTPRPELSCASVRPVEHGVTTTCSAGTTPCSGALPAYLSQVGCSFTCLPEVAACLSSVSLRHHALSCSAEPAAWQPCPPGHSVRGSRQALLPVAGRGGSACHVPVGDMALSLTWPLGSRHDGARSTEAGR